MSNALEAKAIPEDVMRASAELLPRRLFTDEWDMHTPGAEARLWTAVRKAICAGILAEREKAEKLADSMYLTGVHDARVWVRSFGYPDASDRIIEEVNKRAERTGLPKLEA